MSDFSLAQALEGPEPECESRRCSVMDDERKVFTLDEGLDLVVSRSPRPFLKVATVVMAVSRMRKPLIRSDMEDIDDGFCGVIMDSMVNETIMNPIQNVRSGRTFQRADSVTMCTLCDSVQKYLVCNSEQRSTQLQLQAVSLAGGHSHNKVFFKMVRYNYPRVAAHESQTVVLSLTNSSLHICCSQDNSKVVLRLEPCNEENLRNIEENGNMKHFLFYKKTGGTPYLTMFESVMYRGWFISTSPEEEDVEMCEADTAERLMHFRVSKSCN